ncbi:MAG: AbrB/MazE/SpoVT family DNA-binding domain-containing protein [Thaumarchaeota archaeon]|nr:AbrB/MazE/SpoVT family DNA-binding domain-containing protein [Nitrososphaerota archaeon]
MERRIRVSTQGRITIPKAMRDKLKLMDGQPIVLRSDDGIREILLQIQPTMTDYE